MSRRLGHFNGVQAVGATVGVIIAALYMLTAVQKMFFGPLTKDENRRLTDINGRELIAVAPFILMVFRDRILPADLPRADSRCKRCEFNPT